MLRLRRPASPVHLLRQLAAVALLCTAVLLSLRPGTPPAGTSPDPTVPVVVAATDLPAGAVLDGSGLVVVGMPPGVRPTGSSAEVADLAGRVLAAPLRSGEPVTDVRVVGAGVTALLPPGQVAAPVRPADLAVAALVRAGDRVDVLATVEGSATAEVVARGALVLSADGRSGDASAEPSGGLLLVAVLPETAARLAAAAASATLTRVLPPP